MPDGYFAITQSSRYLLDKSFLMDVHTCLDTRSIRLALHPACYGISGYPEVLSVWGTDATYLAGVVELGVSTGARREC